MACITSFTPTGLDIRDDGVSEAVTLCFEHGDDHIELTFTRASLPLLFDQILSSVRLFEPTTMTSSDVSPGRGVSVHGHDVRHRDDGGVVLDIQLRTNDGLRTMSWSMEPDKARLLSAQLSDGPA